MTRSRTILLDRSARYLLDVRYDVERPLTEAGHSPQEREDALALGRAQFAHLNALLKASLDVGDERTFTDVERKWTSMFEDVWLPDEESDFDEVLEGRHARPLLRYRDVFRLGLAMWSAHLLGRVESAAVETDMRSAALRALASRFSTVEQLLDTYDRASERDDEDTVPWSGWFLSELPDEEAHFIPTDQELLFATLLIATRFVSADQPVELRPREWMQWKLDEVNRHLDRLANEHDRWGAVWVPSPTQSLDAVQDAEDDEWQRRVAHLRALFARAREAAIEDERARTRRSDLDQARVDELTTSALARVTEARVLRHLFAHHGAIESVSGPPEGHRELGMTSWLPKDFLVPDSRVVGLDMVGGDIARSVARAESQELLRVLSAGESTGASVPVAEVVRREIGRLRSLALQPSLLLLPVGWQLRRELGLQPWNAETPAGPLVPPLIREKLDGAFDGVPVLDVPVLERDRMWLLDLPRAAHFVEWPSDEDSGVRLTLRTFDAEAAAEFLRENPNVRPDDRTVEETIVDIQERVLLRVTLCWTIEPRRADAAVQLSVPTELQREQR